MSKLDREGMKQLEGWNPMKEAYDDSKFNKYMSGPGADLEDSLQPPQLTKQKINFHAYLVFSHVPANLTIDGLLNICSQYGRAVRGSKKDSLFFVNFSSINDMERVFTKLQKNSYGFRVHLGNKRIKEHHSREPQIKKPVDTSPPIPFSDDYIDYERSYQTSTISPPRPRFVRKPLVSKEDYENSNNLLSVVDPQRHFLIEEDAHDLERLPYSEQSEVEDGKFNFYTGRAYYVMSKEDESFIEEKCKASTGSYDSSREKFTKFSPVSEDIKTGRCESCKQTCDTVCSRCSSFFCSAECQAKEWQKHRYTCGKPEGFLKSALKEENGESSEDTESQEQPSSLANGSVVKTEDFNQPDSTKRAALEGHFPRSGNNVTITAISKTNVVFVRSKSYSDKENFFNTVTAIQREAKFQRKIQHTPQKGDIVFTKFKVNQFNRAMILNADDIENIKLIYIDYGNIDTKSVDELYDAPDKYWYLPRMAVPIILKDVPDFFMTEEVKTLMYAYLNNDLKIMYLKDDIVNGVQKAELFDLATNKSFNSMILMMRDFDRNLDEGAVVFKEHLEYKPLPSGENIKLIVMDSSLLHTAFICCTTEAYAYQIEKFQQDIQAYAALNFKNKMYTPRVNELCIAKYDVDNLWYRGRCVELVGDGHPTILFIDYGNVSIVSVENIRKYPEEFSFPLLTGDCEIYGLPEEITPEIKKKLDEELKPGKEIVCDKVERFAEDRTYALYLDDLLKRVLD